MTDVAFARRHLFKAAGIVAAGVLGKTVSASAMTWGDNYHHESLADVLAGVPPTPQQANEYPFVNPQDPLALRNVDHCLTFDHGVGCNLPPDDNRLLGRIERLEGLPITVGRSCFLKGTHILTADGERPIERLQVGDHIPTARGIQPIEWIAHFTYCQPWDYAVLPVRIARDALADGVPSSDLYITQEHAVVVDGELVTAGSLLNGKTITLDPAVDCDVLEYYHLKFRHAEIITAENTLSELLVHPTQRPPVLSFWNWRQRLGWHLRSALSPWIDIRHPLDHICDRLAERAAAA